MRILAVLANVALLVCTSVEFYSSGLKISAEMIPLAALTVIAPILSLIAIFTGSGLGSWLTLLMKRKALEEQKKIDAIKKG